MKFNPLLDNFPTSYNGFEMNTDFRVGILLSQLFDSENISDEDKKIQALSMLYACDITNDIMKAWEGVVWFINLGYNKCINTYNIPSDSDSNKDEDKDDDKDTPSNKDIDDGLQSKTYDFEFDASRIYTAFLRTYGVDLSVERIHFFKFMFMLSDLDEDCSHSKVVSVRQTSLQGKKGKERAAYVKMKRLYALPVKIDSKTNEALKALGFSDEDIALM